MNNSIQTLNKAISEIAAEGMPTFEEREHILDCIREMQQQAETAYEEALAALVELEGVCGLDHADVDLDNNIGSFGEVIDAVLKEVEVAFAEADKVEEAEEAAQAE
ncbi:MAG: hypothetical protein ACRC6V_00680 [Bacteroidales bacterium]